MTGSAAAPTGGHSDRVRFGHTAESHTGAPVT